MLFCGKTLPPSKVLRIKTGTLTVRPARRAEPESPTLDSAPSSTGGKSRLTLETADLTSAAVLDCTQASALLRSQFSAQVRVKNGLVLLVSCPEPRHVGSNSERHTVEGVETAALKDGDVEELLVERLAHELRVYRHAPG